MRVRDHGLDQASSNIGLETNGCRSAWCSLRKVQAECRGQIAMTQARSGTLAERYEQGVSLRQRTPREKHANLLGPSDRDPVAILAASDRTRISELLPVRYEHQITTGQYWREANNPILWH